MRFALLLLPLFGFAVAAIFPTGCGSVVPQGGSTVSCSINQSIYALTASVGINTNKWGEGDAFSTLTIDRFEGLAQSFQVSVPVVGNNFLLAMQAVSSTSTFTLGGTLTGSIEKDSPDGPSGSSVMTATVAASTISVSSSSFVSFTSSTSFSLTAYTTYWITLKSDSNPSSQNYILWNANGSDVLPSGIPMARQRSTGVWSKDKLTSNREFAFKLACPTSTPTPTPTPTPSTTSTSSAKIEFPGGIASNG